jgi:hypothetical protein
MTNVAELDWLQYVQPSSGTRPTAIAVSFPLPPDTVSGKSSAAREPRLFALHDQLNRIATLPTNWDGRRSARPERATVEHARQFLDETFRQTVNTVGWLNPFLSVSEDGEIVFEWWNGIRKLTVYVGQNQCTYVKSWGPHLLNDMDDGELPDNWTSSLWTWLVE